MLLNKSFGSLFALVSAIAHLSTTVAFPAYQSLAGLSERELNRIIARLPQVTPGAPPPPLEFNGTKLVNDADHPWQPEQPGDIRGPCPGLNTLAAHGVRPFFISVSSPQAPVREPRSTQRNGVCCLGTSTALRSGY